MAKKPNYYAFSQASQGLWIATYRSQIVFKMERRPFSRVFTINTHGFHTQTTVRAINCALDDSNTPWRATTVQGRINIITNLPPEEPDAKHTLGDEEYEIEVMDQDHRAI